MLGKQKEIDELDLEQSKSPRKSSIRTSNSRRMLGRPPIISSPSFRPGPPLHDSPSLSGDKDSSQIDSHQTTQLDLLIDQVSSWIREERLKRSNGVPTNLSVPLREVGNQPGVKSQDHAVDKAHDDEVALDLDKLENILKQNLTLERQSSRKSPANLRHRSSIKKLQRKQSTASSDTDYFESEALVPSSDVVLDNSKTMSYTGGASDESDISSGDELTRVASYRDQDAWAKFKFEIVRLAHTFRLKGWRKVPLDSSGTITVQRLSGALTNAVYVVSPPVDLPSRPERENSSGAPSTRPRKPPPKLLLRIYGPQVEHLIDREAELAILRRLARKRIGPRLLGTFANGRFEEYFHAKTLTPEDLRHPDTSRQIAKRMRELHDGIELLDQERDDGAFVWRNWDKWVQRVERVVLWLDAEVAKLAPGTKAAGPDAWKRRGLILGVPWKRFREMVEKYRAWLNAQYGGSKNIREQLIFAHNDTQYGNILRMVPTGDSPLLLPANTHKQLVVIDFEYANANLPGLEFANHFTEWCYNYHDKRKPYGLNANRYPTLEEQDRFIRAYVRHRPQYNVSTPKLTGESPGLGGSTPGSEPLSRRPTTSISDFMLDARNPSATTSSAPQQPYDEGAEKAVEDAEVARLTYEARLWRLANTAQWVAWGIVQAKVPGMPDFSDASAAAEANENSIEDAGREELGERAAGYRELAMEQRDADGEEAPPPPGEETEEEFDYLGYAQHRAMFFWGDALQWGLVKAEELPEEVREKVKTVPY